MNQHLPRPSRPAHKDSGFLTVEALFMIAVLVVLIPVVYAGWNMGFETLKARSIAQQLVQVSEAAKVYARSQGLLTSLTPGAAARVITGADLITAGLLPNRSGADIHNAWGQSYKIYYSVPATVAGVPAALTVVVATVPAAGGTAMSEKDAARAASFAGGSGGTVGLSGTDLYLRNIVGGWSIKLGSLALPSTAPAPAVGSIGSYVSLDDKALNSDVLYRVDVPGRPELNQMNVDLDMRDKAVKNLHNIQFNATSVTQASLASMCLPAGDTDGKVFYYTHPTDTGQTGVYACKAGQAFMLADGGNSAYLRKAVVVRTNTLVAKPTCPTGSVPFISVSPANVVATGLGSLVGASIYSSYADENSTQWRVKITAMTALGVLVDISNSTLSVITTCAKP